MPNYKRYIEKVCNLLLYLMEIKLHRVFCFLKLDQATEVACYVWQAAAVHMQKFKDEIK